MLCCACGVLSGGGEGTRVYFSGSLGELKGSNSDARVKIEMMCTECCMTAQ